MPEFSIVLYLWIAQASTMAVLFAVIWLRDRAQKYFAFWAMGFMVHASGVALILLRGAIPDVLSIEVANCLTLSSFFFWISGIRQCDGREVTGWAAVPALIWVAAMLVPDIRSVFALRVATYALAAATGHVLLSGTALTGRFSIPFYRRTLAAIWAIQAANGAVFGGISLMRAPQDFSQLGQGPAYGMIAMACFVATLVTGAKIVQDQSEKKLRQLIGRDPLTGALNRRGLTEALPGLRGQLAGDQVMALLVFDLDHFKTVNDTHGHQAGDAVLVHFARNCATAIGEKGIFCRSGGEEFSAVMGVTSLKDAARIGEAIRRRIAETPIETERGPIPLTVSIGIATMPRDSVDLDEVMRRADRALYAAKAGGRNRCAIFSDDKAMLVPTGSPEELALQIDGQADRQVAVLRRLSEFAAANRNRSMR